MSQVPTLNVQFRSLVIISFFVLIHESLSQTPSPPTCADYSGSCEACINAPNLSCYYCPSGGCMDYNVAASSCTNSASGQLARNIGDCKCLTASSCQDMIDDNIFGSRGWCPSVGKCFQGASSGPYDNIECPATVDDGQWSISSNDCLCTMAQTCQDMIDNNLFASRGWCPSRGKCYQGGSSGPSDDITCPATISDGQWSTSTSDCLCTMAQTCQDMVDNNIFGSRGWYVVYVIRIHYLIVSIAGVRIMANVIKEAQVGHMILELLLAPLIMS